MSPMLYTESMITAFLIFIPILFANESLPSVEREIVLHELQADSSRNLLFKGAWASNPKSGQFPYWGMEVQADLTKALVSGEDINSRDMKGRTPIMHAVATNNRGAFNFFLMMGARLDVRDYDGKGLLDIFHITKPVGFTESYITSLIQSAYHGIDISPIIYQTVRRGDTSSILNWLDKGVSPDYQIGAKPILQEAIDSNQMELAHELLERGASPKAEILAVYLHEGHFEKAEFMVSWGAELNSITEYQFMKEKIFIYPSLLAASMSILFQDGAPTELINKLNTLPFEFESKQIFENTVRVLQTSMNVMPDIAEHRIALEEWLEYLEIDRTGPFSCKGMF